MSSNLNALSLELHWESSEQMADVEPGDIDSVITSPPYYNLKDYGHDKQIGRSGESYEDYLERLQTVFEECYRVLKQNGSMWVVVDSFMKRGDTKLLPYHVASKAEEVGFSLEDLIVWYKPTAIAGINDRSVVNKKEYIVFLSKSEELELHIEQEQELSREDPAMVEGGGLGNVWRHPVKRGSLGSEEVLHKAPFPVSLAKRVVRISTVEGERVLDPFLGSGTTALASIEENRECVGYELNQEFSSLIESRLSDVSQKTLSAQYGTN